MIKTFHGKEYDSIAFAPSYQVASLITGAMDTTDTYRVQADTKIAFLTNTSTHEVVGMFHALDVSAICKYFEQKGVEVTALSFEQWSQPTVVLTVGKRRVCFEAIQFIDADGILKMIADVETVTLQQFAQYDEDEGWEEASNKIHVGFKKSDPTGHFISELEYGLHLI